ncbi:putative cytochrome P450 [Talaromyces proteolyticus]|uniref:Cytochrome P450 n=1 Tax=Talaromyces proteolyticus TaxID=1131652 RepID=A0AAD4KLU8_9EURO|nr:putative cytochrome P450 [Talaromyces proteolyticus]KAH8692166.1 putative cytochrome P450 [Talaromyces proteolyticus]
MFVIPGLLICIWLVCLVTQAVWGWQAKIPGPWYTNITSLVLKYHEFTKNRRLWIHALHQKYGPVVRVAPNEVAFCNMEAMQEIYQSKGSGYDKTEFYDLFKQYGHRTLFTTLNKASHAARRRILADRYSMTNVLRAPMLQAIEQRASYVLKKCQESQGSYLDIYVVLHCYALDCASHFLFSPGGTDSINSPEDIKLMQELSYHDSIKQRYIQHYWPIFNKILPLFSSKSVPLSRGYVLRQSHQEKPHEVSLMHKLQSNSSVLSTIEMAAECMDHMAAGIDTTGDSLCFLMYELSLPRSQHIQDRLRQELVSHTDAKIDELPYLDAVIKEGLRLFAPIPMGLPRYVPDGGSFICGHKLPGGSIVSCQAYSLHLWNTDVFPNAESFSPERWLEKEGKAERDRLFFAFSAGGRGCIGKHLAMVEMKTLLRKIYEQYKTTVASEMNGDMSIHDQIIASRPKDQTCLLVFDREHES